MLDFPAGRDAAVQRLAAIRPQRYARSRNFLDGAVTRLSPYLRHGILDLAEVRDAALAAVTRAGDAYKFVQELAWRDYWRRVYGAIGDRVHDDLEAYKTGHDPSAYADALPADVREARTGLACIDAFVTDLLERGYVHNHARMWFASYVVHHRRIAWQAGARFYLAHLLDGDPASNSLSWQWVASTFGGKPYIFNRENLERYTNGALCAVCPLASGGCPFDASYAALDARLFPRRAQPAAAPPAVELRAGADAPPAPLPPGAAVVWTHPDALSDTNAARRALPHAPALVAGIAAMAERDGWSARRRAFVDDGARLLDARLAGDAATVADAAAAIVAFAHERGAGFVATTASPDPLLRAIGAQVATVIPLVVRDPPRFVRLDRAVTLRRFSPYWKRTEGSAFAIGDDASALDTRLRPPLFAE
jgi:deoxyribodipyrimidine photo-lyase